jgi:hypothetical protein
LEDGTGCCISVLLFKKLITHQGGCMEHLIFLKKQEGVCTPTEDILKPEKNGYRREDETLDCT